MLEGKVDLAEIVHKYPDEIIGPIGSLALRTPLIVEATVSSEGIFGVALPKDIYKTYYIKRLGLPDQLVLPNCAHPHSHEAYPAD